MHMYDFYDAVSSFFLFLVLSCVLFFCLNFNVLCFVLDAFFSSVDKKKKNAMIDRLMLGFRRTLRHGGGEVVLCGEMGGGD